MSRTAYRFQPVLVTLLTLLILALGGCGGDAGSSGAADGDSAEAAGSDAATDVAAPSGPPAPTGTSSITGILSYEGRAPSPRPLDLAADPACAAKHSEPVYPETVVIGDGSTLANVFVRVTAGLSEGSYAIPTESVVIDQNGCRYQPHVVGVRVGQGFLIKNSDGLLHNVHSLSKINSPFNRAMPGAVTEAKFTFEKEEGMFRIKCDVHPWMSAYVGVVTHPYFAVTGIDGSFEIGGLAAGTYTVEAWHERLGTQTAEVTVGEAESASADFTFQPPS